MKVVHAVDDQVLAAWLEKYGQQAEQMNGFKQFAHDALSAKLRDRSNAIDHPGTLDWFRNAFEDSWRSAILGHTWSPTP